MGGAESEFINLTVSNLEENHTCCAIAGKQHQEGVDRKKLGLTPGTEFVVLGDDGVVILKEITPPSMSQFDDLIAQAGEDAKRAGVKKSDIRAAVTKVRGKR
jgi:hypothetical protein